MKPSLNDAQEKEPAPFPMQEMPNTFSPLGKIQLSAYLTPNTYLSPNASGDTGRSTPTIGDNPESGAISFLTPLSSSGESGRKTKPPQTQWSTETTPAQIPNLSNNLISKTTQDTLATPFENGKGDEDCPTSLVTSLRANDSSVIKPNFRVYGHNVNGLRDEHKLEYLPRIMKDQKKDAYLIQETHLEGAFEKKILNDFLFIHHGHPKQPPQGAKGGVGIILSPELAYQWKSLEKKRKIKKIKRGGLSTGNTTRFMALTISLEIPKGELKLNKNVRYHNFSFNFLLFSTLWT
jgi:hypothetical protein